MVDQKVTDGWIGDIKKFGCLLIMPFQMGDIYNKGKEVMGDVQILVCGFIFGLGVTSWFLYGRKQKRR